VSDLSLDIDYDHVENSRFVQLLAVHQLR
jgi:hypothetical protein